MPRASLLVPRFLERLARPEIRTVLLAGCGGGFDFVHAMLLVPELARLGKTIVIGSYSFGEPAQIAGDAPIVFSEDNVIARRVTAASVPDPYTVEDCHAALAAGRAALGDRLRGVEDTPRHHELGQQPPGRRR